MNQKHLYNIVHVNTDVSLMVESVTQNKNATIISVNGNVKDQKNVAFSKKIMAGNLAYVLASVISIVRLVCT